MDTPAIIETFDPVDDVELGKRAGVVAKPMGALDLQRLEETLHRRIVPAIGPSAHRLNHPVVFDQLPNLVPVHGPIHASWLNQIEIYFSIVQRKALTPNDFSCLNEVEDRLLRFQEYCEAGLLY